MLYGLLMRGGDLSGLAKAKYTKPELRERLKNKIMAGTKGGKAGQWSARKAQLLAAEYEKAGGGYRGKKSKKQRSLSTWTKQEWTTESGEPSSETGEAYAPKRAISALKTTAAGRKKLDEANREKKKATKEGRQFARHGLHEGKDRSGTKKGGVTQDEMVLAKAIAIHEEIAKALQSYVHIIKAIGAPAGYEPVPGSKHGGFRKKVGNSYDYWYPSQKHADKDAKHHTKQAKRAKRMLSLIMRLKKTTPEQLDQMLEKLEAHEEHMEGAGSAHKEKDTSDKTKPEEAKKPAPQSGNTQSRTIQPPPLSSLTKFDDMGEKERKKYLDSLAHAFGSHMRRGGYSISNRNYYWGRYLRDGLVEVKNRKYVFTEKFKKQAEAAGVKDKLYKGKAMPLGTVRTHGGVLKKKTSEGWVPVKGQKKPKASSKKKPTKKDAEKFIKAEVERISKLSHDGLLKYVDSIPVGDERYVGSGLRVKKKSKTEFISIDQEGDRSKGKAAWNIIYTVEAASNAEVQGGRSVDFQGTVKYESSRCVGDDADKAYESLFDNLPRQFGGPNLTYSGLNRLGKDEWAIWNAVSLFTQGNVATCRDNSKWRQPTGVIPDHLNDRTTGARSDISKQGYANARDTLRSLTARKLDEPMTVYRGMRLKKDLLDKLKVGDEIDSRGISSWTKDPEVAEEFMQTLEPDQVSIRMIVEGATHGLDVQFLSNWPEEEEVLLGGKMVLESLKRLPSSKAYEAVFKHVPPKRGKDGLVKASSELQAAFDALFDTSAYDHVREKKKLTAKGKGVDERVWAEATKLATKQGEGDNFAYVMGIYKRLQGSESVAGGSKKKVPAKNYRVQPLNKAPFIGPRGGKWADAKMTIPYKEEKPEKPKLTPEQMKRVVDKKKRDALMKKYKGITSNFPPAGLSFDLVDSNREGDKIHQGALFTWRDKRGKKQAAYSSEYMKRNGEIKFQRVQQMESKYETAKAEIEATLKDKKKTQKQKDAAAVLLIMAETGLRPGHGGQKHVETFGTKGLMTLHADDVKVDREAGTVTFDFIGKKKQRNTAVIKNKALAAYLSKNTNSEPGKPLWKSSLGASDLRDGMNSAGLGEFKPYDFRTRLATSKAAEFLSQHGSPPKYSDKEAKAIVKKAAEHVSGVLNNTPAVAKSSYIAPAVFESWLSMVQIAKGMDKKFADQIFAAALKRAVKPSGPIEEQTAEEMEMEELEAYPLPSWALDEEIAKAAACPRAAQDVKINTKNRDSAIKSETIKYGPLNIDEPGDYWSDLADHWDTTEKAAKKSLCGNCVAFDVSPRMEKCMPGEVSDDSGRLGYCWMHHFKCHSARTCYTWAKGGPITKDEVSEDWQERAEMEKSFTSMIAEIIKGGPYIGPRGGKWADPDHKIAWEEDKHGAHRHDKRAPKPGTKITKKHKGEEHVIEVTEGGYRHHHPDGTKKDYTHKQLSKIATNIAGHARNGYRFFKLKGEKPAAEKKPAPSPKPAVPDVVGKVTGVMGEENRRKKDAEAKKQKKEPTMTSRQRQLRDQMVLAIEENLSTLKRKPEGSLGRKTLLRILDSQVKELKEKTGYEYELSLPKPAAKKDADAKSTEPAQSGGAEFKKMTNKILDWSEVASPRTPEFNRVEQSLQDGKMPSEKDLKAAIEGVRRIQFSPDEDKSVRRTAMKLRQSLIELGERRKEFTKKSFSDVANDLIKAAGKVYP